MDVCRAERGVHGTRPQTQDNTEDLGELKLKEDKKHKGFYVDQLSLHTVTSYARVKSLIETGVLVLVGRYFVRSKGTDYSWEGYACMRSISWSQLVIDIVRFMSDVFGRLVVPVARRQVY